jgi:CheY-like chemotaxis protein
VGRKRILIVEDQPDSRELMALILRRLGYDVAEAAMGLEATDQAQAVRPDLIFMDLSLPSVTGVEAIARFKADPSTRDIPVIVNTAFHNGSAFVERVIGVGAAEVLYKPTCFNALQDVVQRYLPSDIKGNPQPLRFSDGVKVVEDLSR